MGDYTEKKSKCASRLKLFVVGVLALMMVFTMTPLAAFGAEADVDADAAAAQGESMDTYADPETVDETFAEGKESYLGCDPLYVYKYHNPAYVNVEEMGLDRFVGVVTAAKGVASYTMDKDPSLDEDTVIAATTYEIPIYNVDDESDYYVAVPSVNKFNSEAKEFDPVVAYNNDCGETIDGCIFEKGILYIPKTAIDEPTNQEEVPATMPIGIQLNYAIGADDDFSKSIPVQVLSAGSLEDKTLVAGNMFDDAALKVETGVAGRSASDITVYLNGQMMPIDEESWSYDSDTGEISIQALPCVVSAINIVFDEETLLESMTGFFSRFIGSVDADSHAEMKYMKNSDGDFVYASFDRSKMFVGWRGHYNNKVVWLFKHSSANKYPKVSNCCKYLYGVSTANLSANDDWSDGHMDRETARLWAVQSYAVGADVRVDQGSAQDAGNIGRNEQVKHALNGSTEYATLTMYEWLFGSVAGYGKSVKKANEVYGKYEAGNPGAGGNGIGGANNFAFKIPDNGDAVKGFDVCYVPDQTENPNIEIKFKGLENERWLLGGCSELSTEAAEDVDDKTDISVVCLGMKDDYVVFAFVNVARGQNMTAIYKFKAQVPVKVKKVSSNTSVSDNNNCYDVKGAVYGIYKTQAAAEAATFDNPGNPVGGNIITTNENGVTPEVYVDPGETYYFKELKSPKGHWLSDTVKSVKVTDAETVNMSDPPVVGKTELILQKIIDDQSGTDIGNRFNDKYNLAGARFTVKYYDNTDGTTSGSAKRTWVLETAADGSLKLDDNTMIVSGTPYVDSNDKQVWPIGTYTFKEETAPTGFHASETTYVGTLKPVSGYRTDYSKPKPVWTMANADNVDGNVITLKPMREVAVEEKPMFADLSVYKVDRGSGKDVPEGDATFEGTVFSVINVSTKDGKPNMIVDTDGNFVDYGEEVCRITTDAKGYATTKGMDPKGGYLQCGEGYAYKLVEVDPPTGYLNDDWTTTVELKEADENKEIEAPIKRDEPVIRGGVHIHKDDNDLADEGVEGKDKPQGDATLAGAEFTIWNKSKESVVVRKVDYLSNTSPTVNWRDLYHYSTLSLDKNTKEVQPNEIVGVIKTDAKGDASTLASDLPYGTYEMRETKASPGYKIDDTWYVKFEVREEGVIINADDKQFPHVEEPVIRGGVKIQKWDRELDKSEALGGKDHDATKHEGPDLNNIKFTIKNVSDHSVVTPKDIDLSVKDSTAPTDIDYSPKKGKYADERLQEVKKGDVVGVITTSWSDEDKAYTAYTQADALPYGTYEVWETRTNKYYELTDKHVATFQIREDGTMVVDDNGKITGNRDKVYYVTKDKQGNDLVWKDYVWRQGFEMTKIFNSDSNRGGYIPFKVTNVTTGEYHYVVTDANGYMNTEKMPHSQNTNAYDEMIDKAIADGRTLTQEEFKKMRLSEDGVDVTTPGYWFYLGEDGTKAPVDDNKAALPYGRYQIEEIKCDINQNYSMQKFDFWVNQDEDKSYDTKYPVVNLDTITNDEIKIGTTATDKATESHEGIPDEETTIVDVVEYKGLIAHKTYKMKGTLMKKVVGEDGNVTGVPLTTTITKEDGTTEEAEVTGEAEFEAAAGGEGKVEIEFKFNSKDLGGCSTVAFEDLFQGSTKLATHSEITDEGQTVFFPEIRTKAIDKASGTHVVTSEKNLIGKEKATIVDTILYKALVPGTKYKVEGTLMKVVKNEDGSLDVTPLKDKNGNAITAEDTFKPETEDGSFDLTFDFDAAGMETAKIVVYEELSKNGKPVAEHKDPTDADQTMYLPEIKTSAADPKSKIDGMGTLKEQATIVDTVAYKNHAPGEYVMKGVLMDKVTGEPVKDAAGKEITAEQPFTVTDETTDGTVEMTFTLDSTKLANPSVVVFEKSYLITGKSDAEPAEGEEVTDNELLVATHEDIDDIDQTIEYPNPHYDMYKIRTTPAPIKGDSDQYGFRPGDTVLYDVVVKNTGNVDITVDVSDEFEEAAKEYFTEPTVVEVKNADVVEEKASEDAKTDDATTPEATENKPSVEDTDTPKVEGENAEEPKAEGENAETPKVEGENAEEPKGDAEQISNVVSDVVNAASDAVSNAASGKEKVTNLSGQGKNKVKITVKAGETATVVYEAKVKFGAKEYLSPTEADSDSLDENDNPVNKVDQKNTPNDEDGYWNTAKADNPKYPNPENPDEWIDVPEGPKDDPAETPIQELSLHTTATDADSGEHVGLVRNEVKIKDKVEYESLNPGKTYTLVGTLVDKETGKPIVAGSDADKMKNKKSEGSDSKLPNADLNIDGMKEAVAGKDINSGYYKLTGNSKGDSISYWAIFFSPDGSVPADRDTNHVVGNGNLKNGETTIIRIEDNMVLQYENANGDKITYEKIAEVPNDNLDIALRTFFDMHWVDGKYKSSDDIAADVKAETDAKIDESKTDAATEDKATETKATDTKDQTTETKDQTSKTQSSGEVTVTKTFRADNANGSETLEFAFSGVDLSNKSVVAFERLYEGDKVDEDKLVAVHEDVNDAAQTVVYPTIKTKANYKNKIVTDTVTYTNLIPGMEYELSGVLMDKKSGNSTEITATKKFTPDKANGSVDMSFEIDASKFAGKSIVVFETLKLNGNVVAEHKDINDKDQTVTISKGENKKDGGSSDKKSGSDSGRSSYKTGDFLPYILTGILLILLASAAVVYRRRRQE